jgi:hypothetical protein
LCHSRQQAEQVKAKLAEWLAPRGLSFNEDKTRIVDLATGFNFLGFNVRRYDQKLLIKPSKVAIQRIRERLRTEMRTLRGSNAAAVITALNPVIKGWAACYRGVVSKKTFSALDDYLWKLTYKWAVYSHANKPKRWVVARYFGKFNKFRNDRWVFGDTPHGWRRWSVLSAAARDEVPHVGRKDFLRKSADFVQAQCCLQDVERHAYYASLADRPGADQFQPTFFATRSISTASYKALMLELPNVLAPQRSITSKKSVFRSWIDRVKIWNSWPA